jgi:hypothetical protein
VQYWNRLFRKSTPPSAEDTRVLTRLPTIRAVQCEVITLQEVPPVRGVLLELFQSGFVLMCDEPLEPGIFLTFRLQGPGGISRVIRGQVLTDRQYNQRWKIECSLVDRLQPEEVESLLASPPRVR